MVITLLMYIFNRNTLQCQHSTLVTLLLQSKTHVNLLFPFVTVLCLSRNVIKEISSSYCLVSIFRGTSHSKFGAKMKNVQASCYKALKIYDILLYRGCMKTDRKDTMQVKGAAWYCRTQRDPRPVYHCLMNRECLKIVPFASKHVTNVSVYRKRSF